MDKSVDKPGNNKGGGRSSGAAARDARVTGKGGAKSARPVVPPVDETAQESAGAEMKSAPLGRSSDEDLMSRTQKESDQQAYAMLYERYHQAVLSYLYRMMGNLEDVESIGQEVFLRAYRFRATYRYPQKFSTWLFTISRNLAINYSRRRKRSPVRNITELNLEGVEMSGDPRRVAGRATDDLEKQEEIARVLEALEGLPADQKEVIVLGIFQDLSYAEIEGITGTKAVTLRSRMFHGLKRLGRLMGGKNVDEE